MNWYRKVIAWFFGIEPIMDDMKKLIDVQKRQISQHKSSIYIPVEPPTEREMIDFNTELADISKSRYFAFLLHAMETEILIGLRGCPIENANDITMQMRGALQIIERIRQELKRAETGKRDEKEEDPDFLLSRIEQFTQGSRN